MNSKTPEQNGAAERLNRTLVEMTRAMLLDAELVLGGSDLYSCILEKQESDLGSGRYDTPRSLVREETMCGALKSVWMHSLCACSQGREREAGLENQKVHLARIWKCAERISSV